MFGFLPFAAEAFADIAENQAVYVTGVVGTTALGTATVNADANVTATGVEGVTALGTIAVTVSIDVLVIGVQGIGEIGAFMVWSDIDTAQTNRWVDVVQDYVDFVEGPMFGGATFGGTGYSSLNRIIYPKPGGNWVDVDAAQDADWQDVLAA